MIGLFKRKDFFYKVSFDLKIDGGLINCTYPENGNISFDESKKILEKYLKENKDTHFNLSIVDNQNNSISNFHKLNQFQFKSLKNG